MSRFAIQQIKANNVYYAGVRGFQVDRGQRVQSEGSDGTVNETAHHETRRSPTADLTTFAIKDMLKGSGAGGLLTGSTDLPMVSLDGANGLVMVGAKQASNNVGYAGGSVHVARTALRGLIYMSGLRWSDGGRAELMMRGMFFGPDGLTDPVQASLVALPTQPVPNLGFTLSAMTVAGSTITSVNSLEVAIEPRYAFQYSAGLAMPVALSGAGVEGKLAITARVDIGDIDLGDGTGATSFVFTRFANGGGYTSDTATLTLNGAWSSEQGVGGENGANAARSLLVRTVWDGVTKPLTWSVT